MASEKSVEAKMGAFLLKGYCMLNETCPADGSIPMFRKRDGTIICCCSARCKYSEGYKPVQAMQARVAAREDVSAEAPLAKVQKQQSAADAESARDVEMQRRAEELAAEIQEFSRKPAQMQESPEAETAKDLEMDRRAKQLAAEMQGGLAAHPTQGTGQGVQGVSGTQRPPKVAEDPSAAMGKYMLQGYCMLNEYCPNGTGVPLLRGRDGSLVCCCGDASCRHSTVAPSASEKPTPVAVANPNTEKMLSTPAAPVISGVRTLTAEQMEALYGAEEPQAIVADVLSGSMNATSSSTDVCPSKSISKYMLAGYCLLNQRCPCGHQVPLVRSKDGVKVCCCGDPSCSLADRTKEKATAQCTEVLDSEWTSIHAGLIAETEANEEHSSAPAAIVSRPEPKWDPSRAMGPYLLKGYSMLNELCPNGHGVPLLKSQDGVSVCCCGDQTCEFAEEGGSKAVLSGVQHAAPDSQQQATLQDTRVTHERPCIEITLHNDDFKFRSVSLVQRCSDRMILRGGSNVVRVRLTLQTDEGGRSHDMSSLRASIASECKRMTDMALLPEQSDRLKIVAQNGNIVVATSTGQRFDFLDSGRECILLPCKNVDIAAIAEYLWERLASLEENRLLRNVLKWMEVTVNDSFAESAFRKVFA